MEKPAVRISVRNLVEFILRSGDLDNRRGAGDKEAMLKGSRLHRKIQSRMGSEYRAEVSMKLESEYEDVRIIVEGRADGIFTEDDQVWIDEIKGVYADIEKMEEPVAVHKAQAKCYAWICAREQGLERAGVQMTYGNLDTEEIRRFREIYTAEELRDWYQGLLDAYHKWIAYQIAWKKESSSMEGLEFPFAYIEKASERSLPVSTTAYLQEKTDLYSGTYRSRKNHVDHISGSEGCGRRSWRKYFLSHSENHHQDSGRGSFSDIEQAWAEI